MSKTKLPPGITLGPNLEAGSTYGLKSRYLVSYLGRPVARIWIQHGWGMGWKAADLAGRRLAGGNSKENNLRVIAELASQQGALVDEVEAKRILFDEAAKRDAAKKRAADAERVARAAPQLLLALERLLAAASIAEGDCAFDLIEQATAHEEARAAIALAKGTAP